MVESALRQIGLTAGEIRVYLSLLELGSSTTGNITKHAGISGSKVYEVLDRLQEKGLASSVTKNNVKHFDAAGPERILDYLEEKKESIEQEKTAVRRIIPELILKRQTSAESEVKVFTGWDGLKTANRDIIDTLEKGEEWLEMGLTTQPKAWERHFNKEQQERASKGIVHKALINEQYRAVYETRRKLPHTEYRFLPKELEMPTSTEIYADRVLIFILLREEPMAIMIRSEAVAESYRKYFYLMWELHIP